MTQSLVVKNAVVVLPETGPMPCNMVLADGRVSALGPSPAAPPGAEILDAGGRVILPGLIDPHIHYGWVPPIEKRIRSESACGVSGGVTTFVRYFRHPDSYLDLVDEQIELSDRLHYQDHALHLTIFNHAQITEIPQYVQRFGVTSFKIYLNMKGPMGRGILMDLRPGAGQTDPRDVNVGADLLHETFRTLEKIPARCRLSVHCEDGEILYQGIQQARRAGLGGLAAWNFACSDLAEALSISQVALLSRTYNVPVYFPHIGSRGAIRALREARALGTDFIAETGPHYLTLTTEADAGVLAKVMPPIRTADHQAAVWQALAEGLLETIGSDHVAFTVAEKNPVDIWTARSAFPGTGLILPLLLSEGVARKRLSLQGLARITSYHAARAFGLYPRKGTLLPGSDADFVIIDEDQTWEIAAKNLATASDFSIYEGMKITGAVKSVYVRGIKVFENGRIISGEGVGKYLRRA